MSTLFHFNQDLIQPLTETGLGKINATNGVIYGVSLITSGIEARGHGLQVDDTTLKQMLAAAQEKGQVSVKTNHGTGADAVNGYLNNFRIVGKKLLGDWHLLKTHPQNAHILEMAERMPKNVGLSAAFMGEPEKKKDAKFARCSELVSVDLVAQPAANPDGMFAAKNAAHGAWSMEQGSRKLNEFLRGTVDMRGAGMAKTAQPGKGAPTDASQEETQGNPLDAILGRLDDIEQNLNGRLDEMQGQIDEALGAPADKGEGDEEDEGGEEFEGGPGEGGEGGEGGEFAADNILTQFSQRLFQLEKGIRDEKQKRKIATERHAFEVIQGKVDELLEFNAELMTANQAAIERIQELEAALASPERKRPSAGVAGMFAFGAAAGGATNLTAFETRVQALVGEGKSKSEAVDLAVKEDPARYATHLEAKAGK